MTEDEAKQRWCPFASGPIGGTVVGNRRRVEDGEEVAFGRCIASSCMAWRTGQIGRVLPGDEYKTFREEGYCGLAGSDS